MLNNVILMGRLTKEPELKTIGDDVPVANFTIAVDRPKYKDKEKQTDFIRIVAWRKTAEFVSKYFTKGQLIYIVGKLNTRSWEDESGKHYAYDVIADEVGFAEGKKKSDGDGNGNDNFEPDFSNSSSNDDDLPF